MNSCENMKFCREMGAISPTTTIQPAIPRELGGQMSKRLIIAAGLLASLWTVLGLAALLGGGFNLAVLIVSAIVIAASIGLIAIAQRAKEASDALATSGSLYLLFTSLAIAVTEFLVIPDFQGFYSAPWIAVWVAFFPMLVPCAPKRTLIKGVLAATMAPLAFAMVMPFRDIAWPTATQSLFLFVPAYVAATMAYVSSRYLNRLGADIRSARSLGLYELEFRLGVGGMGEVWRAKHHLLARPAAIKLVKPSLSDSKAAAITLRRFEREAQVTAALQSPHTVQLYDFGVTEDGVFYYVMELLEGKDLDQLVREHGPMPAERVVHILKQALDSLAEAHERGGVHRDIKPANIHLSKRGLREDFVKVLDFGLVKPREGITDNPNIHLTADNAISGTPAFLAPEIITGEQSVDGRADLYALACVGYWLLTGQLVFTADSPMKMAIAHVTETPIPPSARSAVPIPRDLEAIILSALAKDPADRPQSAIEMSRMLTASSVGDWDDETARNWWLDHDPGSISSPHIPLLM